MLHSVTDLRLLLARAYFQSAQLGRAEATLIQVIEQSPTDSYAHLLLGRTLQRAGRHAEAARPLALAEALGGYERPQAYGGAPTRPPTPPPAHRSRPGRTGKRPPTRGRWNGEAPTRRGRRVGTLVTCDQRARRLSRMSVSRMISSEGASGSGSTPFRRRSASWFMGTTTMK